jgi:hypothetical protein
MSEFDSSRPPAAAILLQVSQCVTITMCHYYDQYHCGEVAPRFYLASHIHEVIKNHSWHCNGPSPELAAEFSEKVEGCQDQECLLRVFWSYLYIMRLAARLSLQYLAPSYPSLFR